MPLIDPFTLANAEAGNAFGVYLLDTQGTAAVPAVQSLIKYLPLVPLGQVTPTEYGTIEGQLQNGRNAVAASKAAGAVVGNPALDLGQLEDQLVSLISLVSSALPSASGGLESADQALAAQYLGNVAAGLSNALGVWQAKQAALIPPAAPAP